MRIGYPCINLTVDCSTSRTFRLKSYSENRLRQTIRSNLDCLSKILQFNLENKLFFFRITSDLVPFASHPINQLDWQTEFSSDFRRVGDFINNNKMRISLHPDQFTLINSIDDDIFQRSQRELRYHADLLDLMGLDTSAKIQIHVGGSYGDKQKSLERFVKRFHQLDSSIKRRLVVENDDRMFDAADCLSLNAELKIPFLFDFFHHKLNNSTKTEDKCFELAMETWNKQGDGIPMVDYSSQKPNGLPRQHAEDIDLQDFKQFLKQTELYDFDVMLEIKNKERSAIEAVNLAIDDFRVKSFLNKFAMN